MKIIEISVTGLFGVFNHTIPLTHSDRVTIIHGPNGVGKTMMLRMVAALVRGNTDIFERVPFREFRVLRGDGASAVVRHLPVEGGGAKNRQSKLEVLLVDAEGNTLEQSTNEALPEIPFHVLDSMDRFVPTPYRRYRDGWRDDVGRRYSVEEIIERYPAVVAHIPPKYRVNVFAPLTEGLDVFLIETQRLDAERTSPRRDRDGLFFDDPDESATRQTELRVEQYSADIASRIKSVLADYAKHSQESDRTFPERLVRFVRNRVKPLPERDILKQMSELEVKRQRLIELGFLDSESGLRDISEEDVRRSAEALTIYVGDVKEKLAVFDDLSDRVGRLMDTVNLRFKYKKLTLHREAGFRIRTDSNDPIKLDDLSSGEQHELVLLYELLFRVPKNGLVLVDEPEISLHVAWQSKFLEDLMGILAITQSYGIVATHSPVVIGSRWDLTEELRGPTDVREVRA
ncbi:AAA family ATPase [Paraburkholderia kururiensis]|uniref:AAA family ATPase n=1 Tax=Paraburkholderia kururiensis TaxID=984307 RepID=UPI000344D8D4|nr:AAA family ATPase [Paraburkholderia kururiensis]